MLIQPPAAPSLDSLTLFVTRTFREYLRVFARSLVFRTRPLEMVVSWFVFVLLLIPVGMVIAMGRSHSLLANVGLLSAAPLVGLALLWWLTGAHGWSARSVILRPTDVVVVRRDGAHRVVHGALRAIVERKHDWYVRLRVYPRHLLVPKRELPPLGDAFLRRLMQGKVVPRRAPVRVSRGDLN
jgi:hypothetical protein